MGYKKYSDSDVAEEVIEKIEDGEITGNTAYRELVQIAGDFRGEGLEKEARSLIDELFSDYVSSKEEEED